MSNTTLGILMVVVGLGLTSGGVLILARKPPEQGSTVRLPVTEPSSRTEERAIGKPPAEGPGARSLTSAEKGIAFEQWVVKRLNREFYSIKEWRSDKYVEGIYADSTLNPDLEIEFRLRDTRKLFAIECKWRGAFEQGDKPFIEWVSQRQIDNYRNFSDSREMPVFVVMGIGGTPDNPEEVFIANLSSLKYPRATVDYLSKFKRVKKDSDFYFDYKNLQLR